MRINPVKSVVSAKRAAARLGMILISFSWVLFPYSVDAWLRRGYEDTVVAERSELIVVGHLKKESIEYVPHTNKPDRGRSWEHHATLVVTEVFKGRLEENEIPIIIHYGLTPLIGGYWEQGGAKIDLRGIGLGYPADTIQIYDTGSSAWRLTPLIEDAGRDNLWMLRRRSGTFGRKPGTGKFGIVDPEDIQPLEFKDYFLALLSQHPEKSVREEMGRNPAVAKRAARYVALQEIQRILKIPDARTRVKKLLPYYLDLRTMYDARAGIVEAGEVAGVYLEEPFHNPQNSISTIDIIRIWGEIDYRPCVGILIDLLKKHDKFWASQNLGPDWQHSYNDPELDRNRYRIYGEMCAAVEALREIGDPRARKAIEQTKERWETIGFGNQQILRECRKALDELTVER
ncbi:MAG: hypothetical protein ABIH23_23705 [bacterium]